VMMSAARARARAAILGALIVLSATAAFFFVLSASGVPTVVHATLAFLTGVVCSVAAALGCQLIVLAIRGR
jgi:hypothetical protein